MTVELELLVAIEEAIVNRIRPDLEQSNFRVDLFPDDPDEFWKPVSKARAFVGFRQERLQPPRSAHSPNARIIQNRTLEFEILYQVKNLRTHTEGLVILPKVRDLLTGFIPVANLAPYCLYSTRAGFMDFTKGLWLYSQTFEIPYPYTKK